MGFFWNFVLPLLPLSFLMTPVLWRAVCPLATLNMLAANPRGRQLPSEVMRWAGWPAMLMLVVLVPARHLGLNHEPMAFTALVLGAALVACVLGRQYQARAGFCNLICPVLPVERLYGQLPLADIGNPRCSDCTVCTPRGCPDLAGSKTLPQLLGPLRKERGWLMTATGVFACAFPGFIAGYFRVPDGASAMTTYASVIGWSLFSWLLLGSAARVTSLASRVALPLYGALAAALYFWFAAPGALTTVDARGAYVLPVLRAALLLLVGAWFVRTQRLAVRATRG